MKLRDWMKMISFLSELATRVCPNGVHCRFIKLSKSVNCSSNVWTCNVIILVMMNMGILPLCFCWFRNKLNHTNKNSFHSLCHWPPLVLSASLNDCPGNTTPPLKWFENKRVYFYVYARNNARRRCVGTRLHCGEKNKPQVDQTIRRHYKLPTSTKIRCDGVSFVGECT